MNLPSRPWAWLALTAAAWTGLGFAQTVPTAPAAQTAPDSLAAQTAPGAPAPGEDCGARVEHFELRAGEGGPAVGFASLRRVELGPETRLEFEVHFPEDQLDVWQVETLSPGRAHCLWRERTALLARTVAAERRGAQIELLEWGRPLAWREVLPVPESCAFPLELGERLRDGALPAGLAVRFDPLANVPEILRVELREERAPDGRALRTCELLREDGALAASFTFDGRELARFAWHRGGLVAVRSAEHRPAPQSLATSLTLPPGAARSGR